MINSSGCCDGRHHKCELSGVVAMKKFGEIREDFYDNLLAKSRAKEPRESLESERKRLKSQGKLNG